MLIKNMLDDVGDEAIRQDNPIPIPNVRFLPHQRLRLVHFPLLIIRRSMRPCFAK